MRPDHSDEREWPKHELEVVLPEGQMKKGAAGVKISVGDQPPRLMVDALVPRESNAMPEERAPRAHGNTF